MAEFNVERIASLGSDIADFENGEFSHKGLVNSFKRLVEFYKPCSQAFKEKLKADGYQEGKLKKYVDSTFKGELIITVKATAGGEVFAMTASGERLIGRMSEGYDYSQGLDHILCGLDFTVGLELIK